VFADASAQRLGKTQRGLIDFFGEEVTMFAPVDVASRDLGDERVVGAERQRRRVVRRQRDALRLAGLGRVEHHHLPAA